MLEEVIFMSKVFIGFIAYEKTTAKYLPYFLQSLIAQTFKDYQTIAWDNSTSVENENQKFIQEKHHDISLKGAGSNLGFAKAFNLMIQEALDTGAEYFLALNPDMILKPDALEVLVRTLDANSAAAAVQPKILRWDFANLQKTNIIDSLGIKVDQAHRFFDASQGQVDIDIKENSEIFGFTGAAVLLRLSALKTVAYQEQYFDELMFMYKEDCDLSYRLRLAGFKIMLAPQAVAYHDRSAANKGMSLGQIASNRKNKSRLVKQWSFRNQLILLLKFKNINFSWRVKFATWFYEIGSIGFALLFESYLMKELVAVWKLRAEIKSRRDHLNIKVDADAIERFMID